MDDAVTIRPAGTADGVAVTAVFEAARRQTLGFLPVLHTHEDSEAHFTGVCDQPETWVALDHEGSIVGFASVVDGMLAHLYVAPPAQHRGVGSALFAVVEHDHPEGFEFYVFQRNHRARRFYERRGCRPLAFDRENEEHEPDVRYRWDAPPPSPPS